jgi:5-oxoprolinase (ATP-hydrolysing)
LLWKFWIDVGGTFTDCVAASPDGKELVSKVLSSGIVKGSLDVSHFAIAEADAKEVQFFDPHRVECKGFWKGASLRLVDSTGTATWEAEVSRFDQGHPGQRVGGQFWISGLTTLQQRKLHDFLEGQKALAGRLPIAYELDAGLPAPILGIHLLQNIPLQNSLVPCQVDLGTTRGTNALLTRTGAVTALVTSHGFGDFLHIGDQARTKLFALTVVKPKPLFTTSLEVRERTLADGTVLMALDEAEVERQLVQLKAAGIEALAICLMFGFRYPNHEQKVAEIAARIGFRSIRCSSDVAPVIKIVPRGQTTVLDAYLDPVLADYLNEVEKSLPTGSRVRLMTSSGGLVSRARFSGKDSVLSGPAGGVVGACRVGQQLGFERVIGFDMGGTSTDVSRFDGQFAKSYETYKAGVRIVTPMLEIETVAAGGGSVCWFDGTKLRVGPQSAGANPGPACYGRGGPLAITDINLYLGRLATEQFPFPLDPLAVERRLDELVAAIRQAGYAMEPEQLAEGFLQIANHNMAAAIESVSIAKGFDPKNYLLVSFGGAGSQHACRVADLLGMTRILDHPQSSVLSAVGIRLARQSAHGLKEVNRLIDNEQFTEVESTLIEYWLPTLIEQAKTQLLADGNAAENIEFECSLDLRYRGTDPFLTVNFKQGLLSGDKSNDENTASRSSLKETLNRFYQLHQQQFGYLQNRPVELVAVRVEVSAGDNPLPVRKWPSDFRVRLPQRQKVVVSLGEKRDAGVFERNTLKPGECVEGPAVIADAVSTTIVDSGWRAQVFEEQVLLLERADQNVAEELALSQAMKDPPKPNPIQLEIFNNHFSTIASQMGISLQRTSVSVNVKERLDFSCAIFSAAGDLVVNAPHIPVHLGAMSETVRSTIRQNPQEAAGDVFVTNDPYAGGSHLPDVTVVTPVFSPDGQTLWFWVASRSHHAEIGGIAPGSMPAGATKLGEEGVLIQNFHLISGRPSGGHQPIERFEELRNLLTTSRHPSRSPDENIADIKAQVAANQTGMNQLFRLVEQYSFPQVAAYMEHIQHAAELKVRAALRGIPDGVYPFSDSLDNGATIRVSLTKEEDELTIDFTGTDPVLPDNLNANRAIVSASVMYVVRLLIDEEIPLNEGVLEPIKLIVPECFLNPQPAADPFESPAIVGGNVETSQRIVDCLLGALGLAAASQGTMNNWLMGNDSFGYYETLGGGSGATAEGAGADAVHCHMSNTRLTDPEILESRYPVVLHKFSIRRGSGGAGLHRGGDGMIREIEFLQPMTVSLLTSRRSSQPFGLAGGQPGQRGRNHLIGVSQAAHDLPSRGELQVQPGDRLRLETPGGGGWGKSRVIPD